MIKDEEKILKALFFRLHWYKSLYQDENMFQHDELFFQNTERIKSLKNLKHCNQPIKNSIYCAVLNCLLAMMETNKVDGVNADEITYVFLEKQKKDMSEEEIKKMKKVGIFHD